MRRSRRKKVSNKWWWASSSAVVLMVGFKYGSRALKASRLFFLACFSFFFFPCTQQKFLQVQGMD